MTVSMHDTNLFRISDFGFRILFCLLAAFALCLLPRMCFAQSKPDLLAVDSAFVSGQYEQTELLALRILQGSYALSADERARLNVTMGYAAIMLGRETDARVDFARALDAVPDLELDPVQVSPKFRVVFDEVKAGRSSASVKEEIGYSQVRSIRIARLTNLVVPGSGQWQEGKKWRGAIVFGLQAATVAALVWQADKLDKSREDYLAQQDRSLVQRDYDRYNRNYQMTWLAGTAAGLVYLAAQADLIWLRPNAKSLKIAVTPTADGIRLALLW
jgi:hypothetical protein